jgi:hypothetical protein
MLSIKYKESFSDVENERITFTAFGGAILGGVALLAVLNPVYHKKFVRLPFTDSCKK